MKQHSYSRSRLPRLLGSVLLVFIFSTVTFGQLKIVNHNGVPVVADEVIVRLRTGDANALSRVKNAIADAKVEPVSQRLMMHVVRKSGETVQDLLRAYSNQPDVLYAEPNYVVTAVKTPNDTFYSSLWGMPKIGAPLAWNLTTGGTSMVVGVVDTGVDYNHPDLAGNIWSAPSAFSVTLAGGTVNCAAGTHGFNAITGSCDPMDDNDHGTHTSGSIGATGNNSAGVVGVNWTARIMGLKFLDAQGNGSTTDAINAIEFARQVKSVFANTATPVNVRILSNSWGGGGFSQSLLDEINLANKDEILFVAAAGNNSSNNDTVPFYPANYTAANIISVAATTTSDGLAGFSNYGATKVHLGAPGQTINSTLRGGAYGYSSGTSMATPYVAGAALLALSACPGLSTAAVKNAILSNVDLVSSLQGRTTTGGRLNIDKTLRSCVTPMPLVSSSNPSVLGASVTFTATVTGNSPTGTVIFTDNGATISGCSAVALSGAGNSKTAACSTSGLAAGAHNITAYYGGDGNNPPAVSVPLTQTVNASAPALVGYWALNETAGNTAVDSSGNNNSGTLINGPVWNSAGKIGGALSFDGVNDYVSLGNPSVLIPGSAITLAGWLKLGTVSGNRIIISKYDAASPANETLIRYQTGGEIYCAIGGTAVSARPGMGAGQWYHTACTYDGATIRLYLNGVQLASVAKTGPIADEAGTNWLIGARTPANPATFMQGLLDDIRIYNFALAGSEVTQLYNLGSDTTPPALSNGAPTGTLPAGTTQTTLSLTTDENATCRYSTVPGTAYGSMPNTFSTTGTMSHSTSVSGLSGGNTYTFYVRCQDGASNPNTSDYSISFSVTASDTTPPALSNGAPTGALPAGTTQTTLSLTTDENATCRYSTVPGTAYGSMPNLFSTTGSTSHSTLVTGLSGGNTYTFYVRCQDGSSNSNPTDYAISFSVTASDTTAPALSNGAPTGALPAGTTQTTLSLTSDENATCRYSTVPGTAYGSMPNTFSTTGATSHSTQVTGLSGGNTYTFYVRCEDGSSNSNPTDYAISFSVTASDTTAPALSNGSPTGALPAGTTQTTLSLTSDENATCRYSTVPGTAYGSMPNTFSTTGATSHSTQVTGLSGGNTYTFYVRCEDGSSNSNPTDYAISFSVTASDTTAPALSNGSPTGTLPAGTTQTTLSLTSDENATCRYSTVPGTAYGLMPNTFSTTGATSHSTQVTGLSGGNTYTFYVRCEDGSSNSNPTDYAISFSVTASDTTPPALSNGSPTGTLPAGTTQTTLSLTSNENATCRYSTVPGTAYGSMPNTFSTTGATSHSTQVTGLSGGNTYTFYVRCLDGAGNPNSSDFTISFSVASTPPPYDITSGLLGHWALNESAGMIASDSSGNNNAGTLVNGPVWNPAGRVGGALSFDGVNDYVSLGNPAQLIPGSTITLAGWVKLTTTSGNRTIISKYDTVAPANETLLRYQTGGELFCAIGGTGFAAPLGLVTGQWYHTACTYDGAMIRMYLNGVEVASRAKTGPIADEVGTKWLIGARSPANPGGFMQGLLDDMRIYNRALTPADITALNGL